MRILAVYPYIPYPPDRGAYHRAYHLLKALAQAHEVDMVALAENCEGVEHKGVFEKFCDRVEFVPFQHPPWQKLIPNRLLNRRPATVAHWTLPHVEHLLGRMLSARRYDAVQVFDIVLAQYFLGEHRAVPLVADRTRVDLQYQVMEQRCMGAGLKGRLLHWENLSKLWVYERRVARRCRFEVVCGPDDENFLRRWVSKRMKIGVIPNGVDLEYFHPGAAGDLGRAEQPALLFCGAMDYNPNVDALRWYFAEMHGRLAELVPDLQVWIVGKNPGEEIQAYGRRAGVTVTGAVPDVRPFYRGAWMQMVPLRIGGGTRLKIVESMAMGTPVVSTRIGAQGLGLVHGKDVLLADTTGEFVQETARALRDSGLRSQLAEAGLKTARERLSWPGLGAQFVGLYKRFEGSLSS